MLQESLERDSTSLDRYVRRVKDVSRETEEITTKMTYAEIASRARDFVSRPR